MRLQLAPDVALLRPEPDAPWFALDVWTGRTRLLEAREEVEAARYGFQEALLERCSILEVRPGPLVEETAGAARLQEAAQSVQDPVGARRAFGAARDAGYSPALVLRAFETLDDEVTEEELFEGIEIVRLSEVLS